MDIKNTSVENLGSDGYKVEFTLNEIPHEENPADLGPNHIGELELSLTLDFYGSVSESVVKEHAAKKISEITGISLNPTELQF